MNRFRKAYLALMGRHEAGGVVAVPAKPGERQRTQSELLSHELRAWRPIGGSFNYLGRKMVVTGHGRWEMLGYGSYWHARLDADYADDHGVLHSIHFSAAEARALMQSQPKPKRAKGKR